ncbi:AAA domain-containing protein [Filobasidium floriforme]|uniref:AAA domain-containing protein n=1 Tax=Filobasidium floriforme TaxID=5210 RepID=UPI001E8D6BE2|nr:AAA domain-containing protein [Filobasidium floriforme]KAH8084106.1 AAA domain-containing protein [Filobasidium floriforme]
MNEDIMALSNKLIYSGRLKCGSEQVRDQKLVLQQAESSCSCSLSKLLDESVRCVFVNTDKLSARESRVGDLVQNEMEGKLVERFVATLVYRGIKQEDIGVITPYRQQIKLLSAAVHNQNPLVEVLTADKSQGRDKDCIVISMVRSNDVGNVGELLRDWRRINVSLTRAKKKLVIFGSRGTLQSDRLLSEFFDLMDGKGWIVDLLKSDEECGCGRNDADDL